MIRLAPVMLSAALALTAQAQTELFSDPANLRGERVKASDGRELPIDKGARGLEQLLRKLNTRASLMLIVAHPDDEDGGMLAYYSRGVGARVAMLTLNRGEGGQNAMTGDFEDALGLLRTQELLAADRYLGVDQMFGTEVDFGFSKTKEEAFSKWTHERVLYDAVRAVRLYRPLVIASVFIGGVTDGHGQHQVSGEIAQEVFKAAGDPTVFPELTAQGILPWQPLKVYARVPLGAVTEQGLFDYATGQYAPARFTNYVTGEVSTTVPSSDVVVHEGVTDPLLTPGAAKEADLPPALSRQPADTALSYVQFARIGLGLQRTQIGPGLRNPPSGAFDVPYHLYGTRVPGIAREEDNFFAGIDTTLAGLATLVPNAPAAWKSLLEAVSVSLAQATGAYTPEHLERTIPGLRDALHQLDKLIAVVGASQVQAQAKESLLHELRVKRVQCNDALLLAHGISSEPENSPSATRADGRLLSTADHLDASVAVHNAGATRMEFAGARLRLAQGTPAYQTTPFQRYAAGTLAPGESTGVQVRTELPHGLPETRPYFSRTNLEASTYTMDLPALRNAPQTPWPAVAELTFSDEGTLLTQAVVLRSTEGTAAGQPLLVAPPIAVTFPVHAQVLPDAVNTFTVPVAASPASASVRVALIAPQGWRSVRTPDASGSAAAEFHLLPVHGEGVQTIRATAAVGDTPAISEWWRPVGYGDLPQTDYFTPATDRIVPVQLTLPEHRRIAYLAGTGDAVAADLASVGLPVTQITVADLAPDKLARFDTVVVGVRTYNAHPDLHGAPTKALLDFAREGGNVLVQYQTAEFTGDDAPFPLTLGNAEKVVDETAPVRLLDPSAPVLSSPNQLNEADFHGWIEERGHGFLHAWDDRYGAPTETHDPGSASEGVAPQAPQRGGLVTVRLGKGHWTYCAFALYRQLPEAVPGAYRLFGNLLALADER